MISSNTIKFKVIDDIDYKIILWMPTDIWENFKKGNTLINIDNPGEKVFPSYISNDIHYLFANKNDLITYGFYDDDDYFLKGEYILYSYDQMIREFDQVDILNSYRTDEENYIEILISR